MLTHLLDTTAWLIHLFDEQGADDVGALLGDEEAQIGISVLSLVELNGRLRSGNQGELFSSVLAAYRPLFAAIVEVDEGVAMEATRIREAATARVPSIDALIAATAVSQQAVLVHRDSHFRSISDEMVTQLVISLD